MAACPDISAEPSMASRWRRRRLCILWDGRPAPATLRQISARGAFLETNARPPIGRAVSFHHPDAGKIAASVSAIAPDGIHLAFAGDGPAIAFALAAIGADMTRSGQGG
jgi:hypothetical protein